MPFAVLVPSAARSRRLYRTALAIPVPYVAAAAVLVPIGLLLAAAGAGGRGLPVLLAAYLGIATVTDLLWRRIPNQLILTALIWLVVGHVAVAAGTDWVGLPTTAASLRGGAACFGIMLLMRVAFGGGEGDIKLLLILGAALGPARGVEALTFGYLTAGAVAGALLTGRWVGAPHPVFHARVLPMAPFFGLGVALSLGLPD